MKYMLLEKMNSSKHKAALHDCQWGKKQVQLRHLYTSVVKNIDISISIDTEISERYQY